MDQRARIWIIAGVAIVAIIAVAVALTLVITNSGDNIGDGAQFDVSESLDRSASPDLGPVVGAEGIEPPTSSL